MHVSVCSSYQTRKMTKPADLLTYHSLVEPSNASTFHYLVDQHMHFWVSRPFIWFWKSLFETFIRTLSTYSWTQPAFCVLGPELINFWWVFHGYYGSLTWKVDGVGFLVVVGRVKGVNMAGESIRWPRGEFHSLSIDWTARSLYQIVGFRFFAIFNW